MNQSGGRYVLYASIIAFWTLGILTDLPFKIVIIEYLLGLDSPNAEVYPDTLKSKSSPSI